MTEINYPNNNDNYQSFNNPQKSQYNYLFVSEQQTQNEYNIENNIPFSNEQLNDQFLSGKRKKFQIIFSIILYILGLSLLLLLVILIIMIYIEEIKLEDFIFLFFLFIVSILDIILASTIVYYTKKYQNSRNKCTYIISTIIFIILVALYFLCLCFDIYFDIHFYFVYYFGFMLVILNFIFSIILFFFNLKIKCCKCFN